ncbi:methyltransferase domain-containing protein [Oligella ureolytica]
MIMSTQDIQQNDNPAEVYERYLSRPIADPWTRVLIELANPQSGERVLDLACGTGSVARQVAPMVGSSGQILAVDINPASQVGRAQPLPQRSGAVITWQEGDATKLNLPDKDLDLVLCQQGFQFFPNRLASAREVRRVLREEGRAIISVWQALGKAPASRSLIHSGRTSS